MVVPKSKSSAGLGRTLINDRAKASQKARENAKSGKLPKHMADTHNEPSWVRLRSITQEKALDEFLSTAELAGTEFTAERKNIKIISTNTSTNPYLLTPQQESALTAKQASKKSALTVPRRPPWDPTTTPDELERLEKDAFLAWRRGLAELQENDEFLLTPFERNLEVWRQLWRVIERSDLVVQIVDARNPLLFRTEDLERYVQEVDRDKTNLLLINKADLMTRDQRRIWAEWFGKEGIRFAFYSARLAREAMEGQEKERLKEEEEGAGGMEDDRGEGLVKDLDDLSIDSGSEDSDPVEGDKPEQEIDMKSSMEVDVDTDPLTRILTVHELQALFLRESPPPKGHDPIHPTKIVVGLVGYPNVGKSSTINSLLGQKRVSVSSTPGKTKHFQTIHLPPITTISSDPLASVAGVILCDCPGLVFPNFASTKAELVCNGILPIDQLREWTGPASLLTRRIPREVFEQVYSFKVYSKDEEKVTGEELLISFALARGFRKAGHQGNPDDARAARLLLKDFVNGKILYCHPPPGISDVEFNKDHYTPSPIVEKTLNPNAPGMENESQAVDEGFFHEEAPRGMTRDGVFGGRNIQYGFQRMVGDDGHVLSRKERKANEEGVGAKSEKKHFKGRGKK